MELKQIDIDGEENKFDPPTYRVQSLDKNDYEKYLSPEALEVVNTTVYNTLIELYELGENEEYDRIPYLVQFMTFKTKLEPTEKHIEKLCVQINECVKNGDIFYGTLLKPCKMELNSHHKQGWLLFYYAVSKLPYKELIKKYPNVFCKEGEIPENNLID